MSDRDLIVETIESMLAKHSPFVLTAERRWDEPLWAELAAAGLTGVGIAEEAGGAGGRLADAAVVVGALAAGAAAVPVAEQLLVAGPALAAVGLAPPPVAEPASVALCGDVSAVEGDAGWTLTGTATDVPWAGVADHLVVLAEGPHGPLLAKAASPRPHVDAAANLAGEPRAAVRFDEMPAEAVPVDASQVQEVQSRFALARSVQLAAALEQIVTWTAQYATERTQFGRPLARFQAIQMQLAEMAGEVTAVAALVDAAVLAAQQGDGQVLAAAAKVRSGAAVERVARLAHQVHGAIGFTQEHRLHHLTRRCWSWRDEAGSETYWARVLGGGLAAGDARGLWAGLTALG